MTPRTRPPTGFSTDATGLVGAVDTENAAARYDITIADTGERYSCAGHQSLLAGMEQLGRKGIPIGCRCGGCGICKIANNLFFDRP